jgi:hypothetical protein
MMRSSSTLSSLCRHITALSLAVFLLGACGDGDGGDATPSYGSSEGRAAGAEEAAPPDMTGAPGEVPLTISVSAGGDRAQFEGRGQCTRTQDASIYGVRAARWQIEKSGAGDIRHLLLTVWRPASGDAPDQFSMAIATASAQHSISTVKGGRIVGSGNVTIHPAGTGARFEVVGTDAEGRSVRATVHCAGFTEPQPVAG